MQDDLNAVRSALNRPRQNGGGSSSGGRLRFPVEDSASDTGLHGEDRQLGLPGPDALPKPPRRPAEAQTSFIEEMTVDDSIIVT